MGLLSEFSLSALGWGIVEGEGASSTFQVFVGLLGFPSHGGSGELSFSGPLFCVGVGHLPHGRVLGGGLAQRGVKLNPPPPRSPSLRLPMLGVLLLRVFLLSGELPQALQQRYIITINAINVIVSK